MSFSLRPHEPLVSELAKLILAMLNELVDTLEHTSGHIRNSEGEIIPKSLTSIMQG